MKKPWVLAILFTMCWKEGFCWGRGFWQKFKNIFRPVWRIKLFPDGCWRGANQSKISEEMMKKSPQEHGWNKQDICETRELRNYRCQWNNKSIWIFFFLIMEWSWDGIGGEVNRTYRTVQLFWIILQGWN